MEQEELDAIAELMSMPVDQLEQVPHEKKKWLCQFKGCSNGTIVWDFGLSPVVFHPRKNIGWTLIGITEDRLHYWMCGKHYKWFKRLMKNFDEPHIRRRCMDEKTVIVDIISKEKTAEDNEPKFYTSRSFVGTFDNYLKK